MAKGTTMSRRQRRQDLRRANMLKVKNMFSRFSPQRMAWHSKMAQDGAAAHEAHVKRVEDSIGDQLELDLRVIMTRKLVKVFMVLEIHGQHRDIMKLK